MSTETEQVRSPHKEGTPGVEARTGTFLLHFLGMQIPMGLGYMLYRRDHFTGQVGYS